MIKYSWRDALCAIVLFVSSSAVLATAPTPTPQSAVDELLKADRDFAAAGSKLDLIAAIDAMLADDASMLAPGGRNASGRAEIVEVLRGNPDNVQSKMEWAPVRGGISADGLHGFTFGYLQTHKPDGSTAPGKYLSYWVKGAHGWRVAAYKRRPAPVGKPDASMAPALPAALLPPTSDAGVLAAHQRSLDAAERAFSDAAQKIGLGAAFAKYGSADAVNMGGPDNAGFVLGAEAIGKVVAEGEGTSGSSVSWAPDRVIVASSGDLGVTIGMIRENHGADGKPPRQFPFFTVWHRASANDEWRYIAE